MKPTHRWEWAAAACLVALIWAEPAIAQAQDPATTVAGAALRLKPGDTVVVTDRDGREVTGRLVTADADAIAVDAGSGDAIPASRIVRIDVRPEDSVLDGALIGLGVGVGAGAVLGVAYVVAEGGFGPQVVTYLALGGMGGLAIGALLDLTLLGPPETVYRAAAASDRRPSLSVAPVFGQSARGIALSLSF